MSKIAQTKIVKLLKPKQHKFWRTFYLSINNFTRPLVVRLYLIPGLNRLSRYVTTEWLSALLYKHNISKLIESLFQTDI